MPREEPVRFANFALNAQWIDRMNAARELPEDAIYNFTKFSDLSRQEFKEIYLMDEMLYQTGRRVTKLSGESAEVEVSTAPPASWDWRTKNVVTPVKNQGQCGSCWDFSATETTESVCAIAGYPLTLLSEQQVLQCDTTDYGCNGGFPWTAYQYVIKAGGYDTEKEYPYTAEGGPSSNDCQFNKAKVYECAPTSWKYVEKNNDETTMQTFMAANSPLSVCVDAETWMNYQSGVIKGAGCGKSIDHCVQAVGWQQVGSTNAWIVRNSWGTDWGMNGYLYVQLGVNACAIAEDVSVPCVKSQSGQTVC
jgi:C1A family cysteine protease